MTIVNKDFSIPRNRRRLAHGIQRDAVADRHFMQGEHVVLPIKWDHGWTTLVGSVIQIDRYDDGILVTLDQERNSGSMLENWDEVPLWIPFNGHCGVLVPNDNYDAPNDEEDEAAEARCRELLASLELAEA